jgi:hypothetical protein
MFRPRPRGWGVVKKKRVKRLGQVKTTGTGRYEGTK